MKRQTITLTCQKENLQVKALVAGDFAAHKVVDSRNSPWQTTHIPSGLALYTRFDNRDQAVEYCEIMDAQPARPVPCEERYRNWKPTPEFTDAHRDTVALVTIPKEIRN